MTGLVDYVRIVRRRGWFRLFDELRENLWFDLIRGTDTQTIHPQTTGGGTPPAAAELNPYVPAYSRPLLDSLWYLRDRISGRGFSFFDIGAGKGKPLIIAAESKLFERIVGVEISPEIAAICESNVRRCGLAGTVRVIGADAAAFRDYSPKSVIFAYNPFGERVFRRVLENIEAGVDEAYMIYLDPVHESLLKRWRLLKTSAWRNDAGRDLKVFGFFHVSRRSKTGVD